MRIILTKTENRSRLRGEWVLDGPQGAGSGRADVTLLSAANTKHEKLLFRRHYF